jgi:hypothetical protein
MFVIAAIFSGSGFTPSAVNKWPIYGISASRALTKTEQNYAQIEKELLAVVFGMEKFHQYTYGRKTYVYVMNCQYKMV